MFPPHTGGMYDAPTLRLTRGGRGHPGSKRQRDYEAERRAKKAARASRKRNRRNRR